MDISDDVVVALVAGAKIVGTDGTKMVVKDAYNRLKAVIGKRFKKAEPAVTLIEADPDNELFAKAAESALQSTPAADDPELQEAAATLLDLIAQTIDAAAAQRVGISLEAIEGNALRIRNVQARGDIAIKIKDSKLDGDIEIGDIFAGRD